MKIGVVADTHSREVPESLWEDFKSVDLIIHAGDFCSLKDYEKFKKEKVLKAVFGNMDDDHLRKLLPESMIFECDSIRFGLYHGEGPAKRVLEFAQEKFGKEKVDVVIFGHSHIAVNQTIAGVLYLNPGSPNDIISATQCTYGIIEIKNRKISAKITNLKV